MSDEYPGYRTGDIYVDHLNCVTVMVCERCGALIGSIPDHDAWHDALSPPQQSGRDA